MKTEKQYFVEQSAELSELEKNGAKLTGAKFNETYLKYNNGYFELKPKAIKDK